MDLFIEISLVIAIATILAGLMHLFRQPLVISYIVSGIIVGPYFFNVVQSAETMMIFSHIGIALLLFIVGLSLSPRVMREIGKISLITGIGQIVFTSIIGFLIAQFFGFSVIASIYIALALTFSSTIIIMKLLSDKGDAETLYGKIAIGFLIVQDLFVVFILIVISSMQGGEMGFTSVLLETFAKGFGLIILVFAASFYILPKITNFIAKSQEFLLLFSIFWCLALASLFQYINFSMEIGALLAGVTLSLTPQRYEISSKMRPLRDFFIILFFILLGSQMVFADMSNYIIPIIVLSLFVLIGNPLILMIIMGLMGYTRRNSFLAGVTIAQVSEFSLVLIILGVKVGHLTNEILSFVTTIGLITIAGSTYMILYANKIYPHLSKYLGIFERKGKKVEEKGYREKRDYDVVLFGCDRIGYGLLNQFKKMKKKFLVVDSNPEIITNLAKEGVHCRYGDADDSELLSEMNLQKVKMVISTIPNLDTNLLLIDKIKKSNKKAIIIVVSHHIEEAMKLYKEGSAYVIMPHFLGGHHFSTLIEKHELDLDRFLKERISHMRFLKNKKKIGHEHPRHEKD